MGALLDLVKVLYEPGAVFQRIAEKPKLLIPFIGLSVVQMVIAFFNLPFLKAAMQAQMATRNLPAGGPDPSKFAAVGLVFIPVGIALVLVLSALLLWVLVSLVGGEGKFSSLFSVAAYSAVPTVILMSVVGVAILRLRGAGDIASPQDLQPAVGLDLLVPGAKGFVGAVLKGINPFSVWGLVLTAIGVSTTQRVSKGSGYVVATLSFVIGLLIGGGIAAAFGGRMG